MSGASYRHIVAVLLAALVGTSAWLSPAFGQEEEEKKAEKRIEVIVEDGKVMINGKEVEPGTKIKVDGEEVHVVKGVDGRVLVFESDEDSPPGVRKRVMAMAGPGHERDIRVLRFKDDDESAVWHVLPHSERVFEDAMRLQFKDEDFDFDFDHDFDFDFNFDLDVPNAEVMKLEREAHELARKAREAEAGERAELERELSDLLNEIFDMKMERRRERIARQQEKLEQERVRLDERLSSKQAIIDRRKADLLGDDAFDW